MSGWARHVAHGEASAAQAVAVRERLARILRPAC
jgi:hypothetical protein